MTTHPAEEQPPRADATAERAYLVRLVYAVNNGPTHSYRTEVRATEFMEAWGKAVGNLRTRMTRAGWAADQWSLHGYSCALTPSAGPGIERP